MTKIYNNTYLMELQHSMHQYFESHFSNTSLYRSPNIIRVTKSRRLKWAGHVARMEEGRSAFKILIYRKKTFREA